VPQRGLCPECSWVWASDRGRRTLCELYEVGPQRQTNLSGDAYRADPSGLALVYLSAAGTDGCVIGGMAVNEVDFTTGTSQQLVVDPEIIGGVASLAVGNNGGAIGYIGLGSVQPHGIYCFNYRIWLGRPGDLVSTSQSCTGAGRHARSRR
jgi:hypothetical protein